MTIILSGTYAEAIQYARAHELGHTEWLWPQCREQLMGLKRGLPYVVIGSFGYRMDAHRIMEECEYRQFVPVVSS
jgi:protoheme ferro-lyase